MEMEMETGKEEEGEVVKVGKGKEIETKMVGRQGMKLQHRLDRKQQLGELGFQADAQIAGRQRRPCGDRKYTQMVHRPKSVMVSPISTISRLDGRHVREGGKIEG